MTNFTPKTAFERELVEGVLFRNGRVPESGTMTGFIGNRNRIVPQGSNTLENQEGDSNTNNTNLCLVDVTSDSDFEMQSRDEHGNSRATRQTAILGGRESKKFSQVHLNELE